MLPAHPARRPHPGPRRIGPRPAPEVRPAAAPTEGPGTTARQPLRALLHWAHGPHPRLGRRTALGSIATGAALFVVVALTGPLGAAPAPAPAPPDAAGPITAPADPVLPLLPTTSVTAAVHAVVKKDPRESKKPAPTSHGVISGLAANGIPKVALNAYRVAAARMGNVEPSCGIDWALLAGIGREESDHGRFAGAVLHADGVSTPAIIGPALDGVHWDYIPAPANGMALDGDARYAHALGPMQFIPSTWAIYGTDANGDGRADVFNINDAALGAARYLCAAGGDLRTHAGQVRAVLAYNHSDQYLAQVLALADAYRRGIPISGIPVGITSGRLPKLSDPGYIPPANPGAPTAADKSRPKRKPGTTTSSPRPTSSATTSQPARTSTSTPPSRTSSSPTPTSPAPTSSAPAPSPTPSPTCNQLDHLLNKC